MKSRVRALPSRKLVRSNNGGRRTCWNWYAAMTTLWVPGSSLPDLLSAHFRIYAQGTARVTLVFLEWSTISYL